MRAIEDYDTSWRGVPRSRRAVVAKARKAKPKRKTKVRAKAKKPSARHSKKNPNWITNPKIVEIIRAALGGEIELDPFSSEIANQIVKAKRFFTKKQNGFLQLWVARTLSINPPGGKKNIRDAWQKLVQEYLAGRTKQAVWVGFSVEQLCVLADENIHPMDYSWVLLRKRISFLRENGSKGSPSHSNYICALGMDHDVFVRHFGHLGRVGRGNASSGRWP